MTPEKLAASLIDEYCIVGPEHLNVEEIANAEKLFVIERPLKNFLGMINYEQNFGLITVSSRLNSEAQKIFTITHEMGHFFNERFKSENLRGCKSDDLAGYKSKKINEENANIFAAEFLMHKPWFTDFTKNTELSIEFIKQTAQHFKVSLSAAAIRFIEIGQFPSAVIYCVNKKVLWYSAHNSFIFKFISKAYDVPGESQAYKLFNGQHTITEKKLVRAKAWFNGQYNCKSSTYLFEQCISMPNYNAVMVLLTPSEFF